MDKYKVWCLDSPWNEDVSGPLAQSKGGAGAGGSKGTMDRLFSDLSDLLAQQKVLIGTAGNSTPPSQAHRVGSGGLGTPKRVGTPTNTTSSTRGQQSTSSSAAPKVAAIPANGGAQKPKDGSEREHRLSADGTSLVPTSTTQGQSSTSSSSNQQQPDESLVFSVRTIRRLQQRLDQQEEINRRLRKQMEEGIMATKAHEDALGAIQEKLEKTQQHVTQLPGQTGSETTTTTTTTAPVSPTNTHGLPENIRKAVDEVGRKERAYVDGLRDQFEEFISWHQIEIDALKDEVLKGNLGGSPSKKGKRSKQQDDKQLEDKVDSPTSFGKYGSPRPNKKKKARVAEVMDDAEHVQRTRRYSVMTEIGKDEKITEEEQKQEQANLLRQHRKSIVTFANAGKPDEDEADEKSDKASHKISEELLYSVTLSRRHTLTAAAYEKGMEEKTRTSLESFEFGQAAQVAAEGQGAAQQLAALVCGEVEEKIEGQEEEAASEVSEDERASEHHDDSEDDSDREMGGKKDSFSESVSGFSFGAPAEDKEDSGSDAGNDQASDKLENDEEKTRTFSFGAPADPLDELDSSSSSSSSESDDSDEDDSESDGDDDDDMDDAEHEARMRRFSEMSTGAAADPQADAKDGLEASADEKIRQHRKSIAQFAGGGAGGGIDPALLFGVTLSRRHSMSTAAYNSGFDTSFAEKVEKRKFSFGSAADEDEKKDDSEEEEPVKKPAAAHRKSVAFGGIQEKTYKPDRSLSGYSFGGASDDNSTLSSAAEEDDDDVMDDAAYQDQLRRFSGISQGGADPGADTLAPDANDRVREHRKSIAQFAGNSGNSIDPALLFGVTLSRRHSMSTAAYNSKFDSQYEDNLGRKFSFGSKEGSDAGEEDKPAEQDQLAGLGGFSFGGGGGNNNDDDDEDDEEGEEEERDNDDDDDEMDDAEYEARMRRFSGMSAGFVDNSQKQDEADGLAVSSETKLREHRKSIAQFAGGDGAASINPALLFGVTLSRRHSMSTSAYNAKFDSNYETELQRKFSFGDEDQQPKEKKDKKKKKKKGKKEENSAFGGFSFGSTTADDDDDDDEDNQSDASSSDADEQEVEKNIGKDDNYMKMDNEAKIRQHRKSIVDTTGVAPELLYGVTLSRRHSMSHLAYKSGQEGDFGDGLRKFSFGEQSQDSDDDKKKKRHSQSSTGSDKKANKKIKKELKKSKEERRILKNCLKKLSGRVDSQQDTLDKQQDMIDKLTTELEKANKMLLTQARNSGSGGGGTKRPVHKRKPTATPGSIAMAKAALAQSQQAQQPQPAPTQQTSTPGASGTELFVRGSGDGGEVTLAIPALEWEVPDEPEPVDPEPTADEGPAPDANKEDLNNFSFGE